MQIASTTPTQKTKRRQSFVAKIPKSGKRTEARPKFQSKTRGWSDVRRAQQAARIRVTQPWRRATGPRSAAGKARAALNSFKHGHRAAPMREIRAVLLWQRGYVQRVRARLALLGTRRRFHSRDLRAAYRAPVARAEDAVMLCRMLAVLEFI